MCRSKAQGGRRCSGKGRRGASFQAAPVETESPRLEVVSVRPMEAYEGNGSITTSRRSDGLYVVEERHNNKKDSTITYYNANPEGMSSLDSHKNLHRLDGPAMVRYIDGAVDEEWWYRDGKLYRNPDEGPASITHTTFGRVQKTYTNSDESRRIETYTLDGSVEREEWKNADGEGSRPETEGPAVIKYNKDGDIVGYEYREEGNLHRVNGPAWKETDRYTGETVERYYFNGKPKNSTNPGEAPVIVRREDGSIKRREWTKGTPEIGYNMGETKLKHHRTDGPAIIEYNEDGTAKSEKFYINDKETTAEAFEERRQKEREKRAARREAQANN